MRRVEIISGETAAVVTTRATGPSTSEGDVTILVHYTYGGAVATDLRVLTVRTPAKTTSFGGQLTETPFRVYRNYYHEVVDQFSAVRFDIEGLEATEDLDHKDGDVQWWQHKTSPGNTQYCGADGAWTGGIAIQDLLGAPKTCYAVYDQTISVKEGPTTPVYEIHIDPQDMTSERLWKQ